MIQDFWKTRSAFNQQPPAPLRNEIRCKISPTCSVKSGFLLIFGSPTYSAKGILSHRPGEKPEFLTRLKNLSKNQGLKWLFLGLYNLHVMKKHATKQTNGLETAAAKTASNSRVGVLALVKLRGIIIFSIDIWVSILLDPMVFCWLSLFNSIFVYSILA